MRFYPAPKSRAQAQSWIDWNAQNYAVHGFGLWVVETHDGEFVGDCGLTWQTVGGERHVEVGYHVRAELQRVAQKLGLTLARAVPHGQGEALVFSSDLN